MKIIYVTGEVLECYKLEISGSDFIADDFRIVPIAAVSRIEQN